MSEDSRKRITERQAEARRENGKKSQGPVTDEGKLRSSENSTKHGVWSRNLLALNPCQHRPKIDPVAPAG